MENNEIKEIKVLKLHPDAIIPQYAHIGDSGADLFAVEDTKWVPIISDNYIVGWKACVKTGLAIKLPPGYEWQVRSRSGLAIKNNISIKNSPGTIDNEFIGEICLIIECIGDRPRDMTLCIPKGTKLAQGVISKIEYAKFVVVEKLNPTKRGKNGFGSTDKK